MLFRSRRAALGTLPPWSLRMCQPWRPRAAYLAVEEGRPVVPLLEADFVDLERGGAHGVGGSNRGDECKCLCGGPLDGIIQAIYLSFNQTRSAALPRLAPRLATVTSTADCAALRRAGKRLSYLNPVDLRQLKKLSCTWPIDQSIQRRTGNTTALWQVDPRRRLR